MRSLIKTLKWAEKKKIALGHFNVSNLEQFKAVAKTALKFNVPILLGVSEGERDYWGEEEIKSLVDVFNKKHGVKENEASFWIFLNADHTKSIEKAKKVAKLNFDEIIFDASDKTLEENINLTRKALHVIKDIKKTILVEGELGYIGISSEVWEKIPKGVSLQNLTTKEDAKRFVLETKVDALAPAVGNVHGMFKYGKNPKLDIERIKEIKKAVRIPLVLHGGSGLSKRDFVLAIDAGINIIHISTELRVIWKNSLKEKLLKNRKEVAPYKLGEEVISEVAKKIEDKIKLFYKL
jgi:fructose-bisphosphate aldolase class II